ncbi:hypothetical protein BDY17DRAFT_293373 [Neohortaea acidophila]|uniref:DUF4536 domain-containing protein n=1 Tax=Neohortaea acidophila TaxID=245834 RepID=A0A6A6Q008_9PEZI|nr:uncharacterized protein BDY17DRAFT_293373 [Neohortaea acidophila]KAF2485326.1 hypothetical protein BDY17DRAFT_293373 [Neohortaea acidophila]
MSQTSELDKLNSIDDVLSQQRAEYEDCTPCRLLGMPPALAPQPIPPNLTLPLQSAGSAAFTGLGIYTYHSGRQQLIAREKEILRSGTKYGLAARRMSLLGLSAMLVGAGVYRLVN